MPRSADPVGEMTRLAVPERASRSEEPQGAGSTPRRQIPQQYLAKHPCKVCKGRHCTGNCKF